MNRIKKFRKEKPMWFWGGVAILIMVVIVLVVELNSDYFLMLKEKWGY